MIEVNDMTSFNILQSKNPNFGSFDEYKFNLNDYASVYSGKLFDDNSSKEEILEDLFFAFNVQIPDDFNGHSLSVSDIVVINSDDGNNYYYCDPFGWKNITKFVESN